MKKEVSKRKNTLKALKDDFLNTYEKGDNKKAVIILENIIKLYPKNKFGYINFIKVKTDNYKKCLKEKDLKKIKKYFDILREVSKKEWELNKGKYDEYLNDCKEVDNLKKIRKEIISKLFLKLVYEDGIIFLNQKINMLNNYDASGKKIKNGYDFIKGLFLIFCMIFNLVNKNYLLILTIPFGIFGIVNVYSFLDMNFFKKGLIKTQRKKHDEIFKTSVLKANDFKDKIKNIDENISFLNNQKKEIILKIPSSFTIYIKDLISDNEKEVSLEMFDALINNDTSLFVKLSNTKSSLDANLVLLEIKNNIKTNDDELSNYLNKKLTEKKAMQKKAILMKDVNKYNYLFLFIMLFISISSFIIVIKNFYELNFTSFLFAMITGIISILIYNIDKGRNNTYLNTTLDCLLSCVFNASLVYDLIYFTISKELMFNYCFIEIPIIFSFIFIGFVMLISLFKYKHLLKKLRLIL